MAIVKQLRVALESRPGALAELCSELAKRAVNICAIQASEAEPRSIRIVAMPLEAAKKVCAGMGLDYSEESVLAARLADRPGALGRITRKLADKGINIDYVYGSIEKGSQKALIVIGVADVNAAAPLLK